ncbi:MAG: thioredoxin family protein [Reichenbachiella sp.]|uniref:thioredoxin family protein n=1 Tax=Reichenbachiella sp. TaxID=2184521 RepID=UPI003264737F
MKKVIGVLMLTALAWQSQAQNWLTDIDMAKQIAEDENKKIVLVFAGSDWCGPCIKLERSIWESEKFKNYAAENYVLVKADFPRKKANKLPKELQAHNDALAERYNQNGYFPLVLILDFAGKVHGTTGYKNITPGEYIELLNSFKS